MVCSTPTSFTRETRALQVTTGIALRTRIREIYAIDKLEGMSKTDEFTKALKKAGKQKVDSVVALVKRSGRHHQTCAAGSVALFWPDRRELERRPIREVRATRCRTSPAWKKRKSPSRPNSESALTRPTRNFRSSSQIPRAPWLAVVWLSARRSCRLEADWELITGAQCESDPATDAREFDALEICASSIARNFSRSASRARTRTSFSCIPGIRPGMRPSSPMR